MEDTEEQKLKLSLPPEFVVRVRNNKDGVYYELSVDDFISEVKGKNIETYQRSSYAGLLGLIIDRVSNGGNDQYEFPVVVCV